MGENDKKISAPKFVLKSSRIANVIPNQEAVGSSSKGEADSGNAPNKANDKGSAFSLDNASSVEFTGWTTVKKVAPPTETEQDKSRDEKKPDSSGSIFLFGENLEERVENAPPAKTDDDVKSDEARSSPQPSNNAPSTLFKPRTERTTECIEPIRTGEEHETRICQVFAKLYVFEDGSWKERGRGELHMNAEVPSESKGPSYRLVMRTAGSLRLILNATLYSGMTVTKANERGVIFSAHNAANLSADSEKQMAVFLVSGKQQEVDKLYTALQNRISRLQPDDSGSKAEKRQPNTVEGDGEVDNFKKTKTTSDAKED